VATQSKMLLLYSETGTTTTPKFANWAAWINYCLASFGWQQTNDAGTGRAQWWDSVAGGGISAAANTYGGNFWTLTFPQITGPTTNPLPQPGNAITLTGFTGAAVGNNGTFQVAPYSVAGNPTATSVTVINPNGTTNVSGTGVMTGMAIAGQGLSISTNAESYPPAAGAVAWETWTSTDANSASYPLYVKLWYGAYTGNQPGLWLQLGGGTDGAGNLTGNCSAAYLCGAGSTASASVYLPCYASGDTTRFVFALGNYSNTLGLATAFGVERSKDQFGNDTPQYAVVWSCGYSTVRRQQCVAPMGSAFQVTANETSELAMLLPDSVATFSGGGTVGVAPLFPFAGCLGNPLLGCMGFMTGDIPDNCCFQCSIYGTPHTYLPINAATTNGMFQPGASTNTRLAIRYE
jgi:hypothetical protein